MCCPTGLSEDNSGSKALVLFAAVCYEITEPGLS